MDLDPRLQQVEYFVEATDCERCQFYINYAADSPYERPDYQEARLPWDQDGKGFFLTVGHFHACPICLVFTFTKLNGHLIAFFFASSQVVHHGMIDDFFAKHFANTHKVNADNFHLCMEHCAKRP